MVVCAPCASTCRKATCFVRHGQIYEPNSGETCGTVVRSDRTMGAHISDCLVPWGKDPGHTVPLPQRNPRHADVLLWCPAVEPVQ
jgi:hypothetical protein